MDFAIGELHPNTPHLFADLAELVLTIGYNGRTKLHKNDLLKIIETGTVSPDELGLEDDAEEEADNTGLATAEKNSRREKQLEDILTQLAYRSNTLNNYYPSLYMTKIKPYKQIQYYQLLAKMVGKPP